MIEIDSGRSTLQVASCKVFEARTWLVSFKPDGWASITVCNETGEVSVRSDWLDGSYCWKAIGPSKNVQEFITDRVSTSAYLCEKFFGRPKALFNQRKTTEKIRAHLLGLRKSGEIDDDLARYLWEEAADVDPEGRISDDMWDALEGEPWGFRVTDEDPHFIMMRDTVLPALLTEMRK